MMWLLLATGFTGGLTLVFVLRWIAHWLTVPFSVSAHFSPKGGCTDAVLDQLGRAKKEIVVLARSFSSERLAKGLLEAKLRGVRVDVILDRQNEKDPTSDLHLFAEQGLAPALDTHFTCLHDNLVLIDGKTVLLGSFDFTRQAEEENSDGLLVLAGHPAVASACRKHFQDARSHAREFRLPTPPKPAEKPAPVPKIEMPPPDALGGDPNPESPAAILEKLARKAG